MAAKPGLLRWTAISPVQTRRTARGTQSSATGLCETRVPANAEAAAEFEMDEDRRGEHEGE
jgi:hypothetical protein